MTVRTGGKILVDQLVAHGIRHAFCVPGESFLTVLDALHDAPIRVIVAKHEAGAANMAEAAGKLTGHAGVAFVTRSPGATHASTGVFTAWQDSTPLVLFVGQVPRAERGREGLQELDYEQFFGGMAKWVVEARDPAELPELTARAFSLAASGRPGPVVVSLPEDVLSATSDVPDGTPVALERAAPAPADLARLRALLDRAERPVVVVGGGGWTPSAAHDIQRWAEASSLPVAASFQRQDYIDNRSPSYIGPLTFGMSPHLAERIRYADLIVAIGTRLGDVATASYTLLDIPRPGQALAHVHADAHELGRVYETDLAIVSDSTELAALLEPVEGSRWGAWAAAARAEFEADRRAVRPPGDRVDLGHAVTFLSDRLPADAIVTQGAGNFGSFVHRHYLFRAYRTLLAPCSAAMGYGLPAAVAAKALEPERTVVCVAGDGDLLMSAHELSTAVQERLPLVVLVVNNGMYGTIRMYQERTYPGRVIASRLEGPDFAALARAFGAHGLTVEGPGEFEPAFEEAFAAERPAVLDLRVDPDATTARETLAGGL